MEESKNALEILNEQYGGVFEESLSRLLESPNESVPPRLME
jgi:hypothetical protein